MVRADVASSLPEVFAQHPALRERSRNWTLLSDPVSTSPLIFRDPQPERDGVLMAGDAAGFVDPFVGDGISLALRSGSLAAQLPRSLFLPARLPCPMPCAAIARPTSESLLPVFRASSKIRRMLVLPGYVRKPVLSFLESTSRNYQLPGAQDPLSLRRERPARAATARRMHLSCEVARAPLRHSRQLSARAQWR